KYVCEESPFPRKGGCRRTCPWRSRPRRFDVASGLRAQPHGVVRGRRALCQCAPPEGGCRRRVTVMDAILVVNAGSSSLKFQVFATGPGGDLDCLVKGQMDGIGSRPRLRAAGADKSTLIDQSFPPEKVPDLPAEPREAGDWLRRTQKVNLIAVGHRVVHGGPEYSRPMRVTADVVARLERYVSLAPLHQPNNLAPIRTLLARRSELPQVACF